MEKLPGGQLLNKLLDHNPLGTVGLIFITLSIIIMFLILVSSIKTPWFEISRDQIEAFLGNLGLARNISLITLVIGLFFITYSIFDSSSPPITPPPPTPTTSINPTPTTSINPTPATSPSITDVFNVSKPDPTVLRMDGSVSMVKMIREMQNTFSSKSNIKVIYGNNDKEPSGSNLAVQKLKQGKIELAAISRELIKTEKRDGIRAIAIARDSIAVVVSARNSFNNSLSIRQLEDIYKCKVTNWKQLGGDDLPIKVINRSKDSGTREVFQDLVLSAEDFCPDGEHKDGSSFKTLQRDEDTLPIAQLGSNGIFYASDTNVKSQKNVKRVMIENLFPGEWKYPVKRCLFLAANKETSPNVKKIMEFAVSDEGQNIAVKYHSPKWNCR